MRPATLALIFIFAGSFFAQEQTRTEIKTTKTTWNGVLVDAACQSTHTERRETVRETDPRRTTKRETTVTETVECPVTSTTTSFGLLTNDGRFIRFDNPSNMRVVEIVRSNRDWERYLAERTPLKVRVIGTAAGDVAVVESLDSQVTVSEVQKTSEDVIFDARYKGDHGKLIVSARGLSFEDISDADHSRTWSYSQIKELKRDGDEIKIEPYSGDSMELKLQGRAMSDAVYKMIVDRIVAARAR